MLHFPFGHHRFIVIFYVFAESFYLKTSIMNGFILLGFFFVSAIAVSSAGLIEIVLPENYAMGNPIIQSDNLIESSGIVSNSVGESNIERENRAFDTYIALFCYSPQLTVFDFSKKIQHFV